MNANALDRRIKYALNYVADMTYCGVDAEWHFKKDYNPQIVLDTIEILKPNSTINIGTETTICPRCNNKVEYDFIISRGYFINGRILPSLDYDLIADTIFHSECWNKLVTESPP
jgi:hypothetical protein